MSKQNNPDFLSGLNSEQKKAVLHTNGPVLILAGAGSGKTKVLTHRIAYLIHNQKIPVYNILAVTFTNKAAGEMRDRVQILLQDQSKLPFLGTFHSICAKILRTQIHHLGFKSNFLIFDAYDQKKLVREILVDMGYDPKHYPPEAILSTISGAKSELISPTEYLDFANTEFQEIASKIYPEYQKRLKDSNALDFDDLLVKTVQLFKQEPIVLQKYQKQFEYILIDEYQDTNKTQYQIVKMLSAVYKNLCVVGDDWQAIYSWRGADFRNILDFKKDYPEAIIIKLEKNYRSTKNILGAAGEVIQNNQQRSDKQLYTDNPDGDKIKLYEAHGEKDEAEYILNQILDHISQDKSLKLNDFAIFYRTNAQSRNLEEVFLRSGMNYQIIGGTRFYERAEIKDILAYLRLIINPLEKVSLKRVINLPARGLGERSQKYIFENWGSLYSENLEVPELGLSQKSGLESFIQILKRLNFFSENHSLSEMIDEITKITGYRDYLLTKFPNLTTFGTSEGEMRLENIQELKSVAWNFNSENPKVDLVNFLEEAALMSDIDTWEDQKNAVTFMTLHNAKGLEFPVVFIAGMEENLFPHSRSMLEPTELEEERRLCYVGMTRAKQKLYCIYSQSRMIFGGVQSNPPSRFLSEIPEKYFEEKIDLTKTNKIYDSNYSQKNKNFNNEQKVWHDEYGEGTIVSMDTDTLTVVFPGIGIKKLDREFAPIKK
ncbi:MAG: UvrD-helicase domain-containing protein, partial [bacterium]